MPTTGLVAVGYGRLSTAFTYITIFAAWIISWWIGFVLIELIFNVIIAQILLAVFPSATIPVLDLPTPFELLTWSITQFTPLWGIGTTVLWGFVEEITFGLFLLFGIMGELSTNTIFGTPLKAIATFLSTASDRAAAKK